ncbi:MAG: DUF480 domain-containing protein [Planctomycetota bacterium]
MFTPESALAEPLDANEARLLGVLIEKSLATPENYPLTINAAVAGANQKSNRDPQMSLSQIEVEGALARLVVLGLTGRVVPSGSRVEKYRHNAEEILKVDQTKLAILAELLVRGPQTKGELRQRANRMRPIESLGELDNHLNPLINQGWVVAAPPAPGSRAGRFAQILSGPVAGASAATAPAPITPTAAVASPAHESQDRVEKLEAEVALLRRQLDHLASTLGESLPGES